MIVKTHCDIVIFDCDSTLSKIEGIDYLAKLVDKEAEVAALTNLGMNGEMPYAEVFAKRLEVANPRKEHLQTVGEAYIEHLVEGAKETVDQLLQQGKEIYILSGGYKIAVDILGEHLGISLDNVYAVDLTFDENGNYVDYDRNNPLSRNGGKPEVVKSILKTNSQSILIGDAVTDLESKGTVTKFIGFGGVVNRDRVRIEADIFIDSPNLSEVLLHIH